MGCGSQFDNSTPNRSAAKVQGANGTDVQISIAANIPFRCRSAINADETSPSPRCLVDRERTGNGAHVRSQPVGINTNFVVDLEAIIGPSSVTRATSKSSNRLAYSELLGLKIVLRVIHRPISAKLRSCNNGSVSTERGNEDSSRNSRTLFVGFSRNPTASSNRYGPYSAISTTEVVSVHPMEATLSTQPLTLHNHFSSIQQQRVTFRLLVLLAYYSSVESKEE